MPVRRRPQHLHLRSALSFTSLGTALLYQAGCAGPSFSLQPLADSPCAASPGVFGAGAMTFFVTSTNPGEGGPSGHLGGLIGADSHYQFLATTAGEGQRTWRAYLSTRGTLGRFLVHARDRIGPGPWRNALGVTVARNVDELHGPGSQLNKQTALTETGAVVSGRGDAVNLNDVLTGSSSEGRSVAMDQDSTCGNWTSSGTGSALVGHHDRPGLDDQPPAWSWNSSHLTRGCSLVAFKASVGADLLLCFTVP